VSTVVVKAWHLPFSGGSRPCATSFKARHPETLPERRRPRLCSSQLRGIRLPGFPDGGGDPRNDNNPSSSSSSPARRAGRKRASKADANQGKKPEEDSSGGFLRGWFGRKDEADGGAEQLAKSPSPKDVKKGKTSSSQQEKQEEDSIFRKVQSVFPKPENEELSTPKSGKPSSKPSSADSKKEEDGGNIFTRMLPKADEKKGEEAKQNRSSSDSNPFARFQALQGMFARNATSADAKGKEPNATSLNPLGSFQKLFALDRFGPVEQWITVFPKTKIMPGQIVPATVAGLDLLVVASRDGRRLYCIVNSCSHLGTPLETGTLVRLPREPATGGAASSASSSALPPTSASPFTEKDISNLLSQDGCEDCIVCPLHRTAFALESGDVRGEWCPYPPVLGSLMGTVRRPVGIATFDVRTRGKFVQVRINTPLPESKDGG
jgi:nitrite reductase/ring-hydroxylating ferredoxin subunit